MGWITKELQSLDIEDSDRQPPKLKSGQLCLARFSLDKQLYRAKVEAVDSSDPVCPMYLVTFIDFGNKEKVRATAIKEITPELEAVPPQSQAASLAHLKVQFLIFYSVLFYSFLFCSVLFYSILFYSILLSLLIKTLRLCQKSSDCDINSIQPPFTYIYELELSLFLSL